MSGSSQASDMPPFYAWLPSALEGSATILTPNVRTARLLTRYADEEAARRGVVSWPAARILPWNAWTALLWQDAVTQGVELRVLLNELQEMTLWMTVIQDRPSDTLRPAHFQADICVRANRLLGSYDLRGRFQEPSLRALDTADQALFRRFYQDFTDTCHREGYLPSSHLEQELTKMLLERKIECGKEYLLHGFINRSPAGQALAEALHNAGAAVETTPAVDRLCSPPSLVPCTTPRAEWQHCARWVREQLESKAGSSVAIVGPDLTEVRSDLERELRLGVALELTDVTRHTTAPYEFSSGRPLRTLPMVRDALALLRWCTEDLTLDEVGGLLRSRHLALVESPEVGAVADERIIRKRLGLRNALSLWLCASTLQAQGVSHCLQDLKRTAHHYRDAKGTYARFTDGARQLLQIAGWPGPGAPDSAESQARDRWDWLLDQVATLDLFGISVRFKDVVKTIATMAERVLFAPENVDQPVQVMSFTEALGSTANAMWFFSSGSTKWPTRSTPDALLPLWLQRDLRMPGVDDAWDEQGAADALAQLTSAMGSSCFSYSSDPDDELALPAPLILQQVQALDGSAAAAPWDEVALQTAPELELVRDEQALPPLPAGTTAGGVGVLTTQSQCGFRAWAERRMFTPPSDVVVDGLSPRERGDQVHVVLELFWKKTRDQEALKRLSKTITSHGQSERDELIMSCVAEVYRPAHDKWEEMYLHVQRERLFRLVGAWLDLEETRPPFRILQLERSLDSVPVGPLRLKMRVDRVDEIIIPARSAHEAEIRGTLLIDYKTGPASRNDWLGERPAQPQLPAYATSAAVAAGLEQVHGIAFAMVRAGEDNLKLEGLAEPGLLPDQRKRGELSFAEQRVVWTEEIHRLATAFAIGDASVAPRRYPQTCEHCSQRIFCRIDTEEVRQEDEEAAEMEDGRW